MCFSGVSSPLNKGAMFPVIRALTGTSELAGDERGSGIQMKGRKKDNNNKLTSPFGELDHRGWHSLVLNHCKMV